MLMVLHVQLEKHERAIPGTNTDRIHSIGYLRGPGEPNVADVSVKQTRRGPKVPGLMRYVQ